MLQKQNIFDEITSFQLKSHFLLKKNSKDLNRKDPDMRVIHQICGGVKQFKICLVLLKVIILRSFYNVENALLILNSNLSERLSLKPTLVL